MYDSTSLLFGLDEFFVDSVAPSGVGDGVDVVIEMVATEAACPVCAVFSSQVKERRVCRIKDVPGFGRAVGLSWRKRRLVCAEVLCPRGTFTQTSLAVPARSRLTGRLRAKVACAIAGSNRSVSDVCREYSLSWGTVHKALVVAAAGWLPAPEATGVLGLDETRARSVRWICEEHRWRRTNPWMTSFVNADPSVPGRLLGLVPGRSGACVKAWIDLQSPEWRAGVHTVVIDPSAPYAAGIRASLPHAQIAVDHFHLVALANQMVTEVRQRVARERHHRRGLVTDPAWAHRRMLLTAGDRLSARQLDRLAKVLATDDPTDEIGAAWACKELLRQLLAATDPWDIRARLWRFHNACVDADMPETARLAQTIDTWWPHIKVFLRLRVTNARTEGFNRTIKQVKRVGCGFRNMDNYERRIMAHIALTRSA